MYMFDTGNKKMIRKGKVKEVWDDGNYLYFKFTDNISVFDKIIPSSIPYKGMSLCLTSYHWFSLLNDFGIKNHFIELIDKNVMKVTKLDVIYDYSKITTKTTNYLIPLEVIVRYYAAGSLMDRIEKGEINPESLGFPKGYKVKYGDKLPSPFFEVTTKLEKVDRPLTEEEALKISGLTKENMKSLKDMSLKIDTIIHREIEKRGLIHVDGKKEYGMDKNRNIIVIDTFGTADEDRFWDAEQYKKGKFIELSKEEVRQYYRSIGYFDKLMEARKNHKEEPEIPPLPEEKIKQVSNLYIDMYTRLTGKNFVM